MFRLVPLIALLVLLTGCATVITPPPTPEAPVPVLIIDHGRHTSLILPDSNDGLIRYAYGDWRYYAEGERGFRAAFTALLRNSPGTLGRRELPGPAEPEIVITRLRVKVTDILLLHVEADAAERLRMKLDTIHAAGRDELLFNPRMDLEFVPHPRPYTVRYNSNRVIADWLVVLGCEVRGRPLLSGWRIAE